MNLRCSGCWTKALSKQMKALDRCEPRALLVYFACMTGISMFFMHPVIVALSLLGALSLFAVRNGTRGMTSHALYLGLFAVMALINPLIHHNGVTVLFVLNNNPVTLEALLYGVNASAMILAVLYWFRSFSQIMTSDKLMHIFGRVSPRIALIISMALRYVPRFTVQAKRINAAQKALGLYREENAIDGVRGGLRVFSILVTWALENGITTADSMAARGYGTGRRTYYGRYRMEAKDWALIAVSLLLLAGVLVLRKSAAYGFYPALNAIDTGAQSLILYVICGLLAFLPTWIELGDEFKWHCLKSRL